MKKTSKLGRISILSQNRSDSDRVTSDTIESHRIGDELTKFECLIADACRSTIICDLIVNTQRLDIPKFKSGDFMRAICYLYKKVN